MFIVCMSDIGNLSCDFQMRQRNYEQVEKVDCNYEIINDTLTCTT